MGDKPGWGTDSELELDWGARKARPEPQDAGASPPEEPAPALAGKGPPGDPRYMSVELRLSLEAVLTAATLRMRQFREALEILIGWEGKNKYEVCGEDGRGTVYVGETGEGWMSRLARNFWPFYRARLECMTVGGTLAMAVELPWHLFFARAEVTAWDGRPMGDIVQRFRLFGRCFDIVSPTGAVLATVEGPFWRPWTFRILQRGEEVAVIRKKWSGLLQETFSDADNFSLEFQPSCTDGRLRQLVLASALLVDLTYFDSRKNRSLFGTGADIVD
ncbi:phospholipid scramblase family protein [Myxococcus fulvus]|uniref:phospholipid scramblase family protein n=1 Tax=Myxococcus fulvus TaxID=33 RepID=UPI0020BE803D|nr:phospholipid scramblase family protein [Myxococcus fulvus]MCK8499964.1 phospholipid scramblase family protein [Myxococcus fulvus]